MCRRRRHRRPAVSSFLVTGQNRTHWVIAHLLVGAISLGVVQLSVADTPRPRVGGLGGLETVDEPLGRLDTARADGLHDVAHIGGPAGRWVDEEVLPVSASRIGLGVRDGYSPQ